MFFSSKIKFLIVNWTKQERMIGIVYLQNWQLGIIITHQEHQNDLNKLPKSYEMIELVKICSKNRKICFLLVLKISQNIQNIVIKSATTWKYAFLIQKIIEICFEHVLTGSRNEYTNTHLVVRFGRVGLLPYGLCFQNKDNTNFAMNFRPGRPKFKWTYSIASKPIYSPICPLVPGFPRGPF